MSEILDLLEDVLGMPVTLHELKHKPGRRRTMRATGSRRTATVKVYESDRATLVANGFGRCTRDQTTRSSPRSLRF